MSIHQDMPCERVLSSTDDEEKIQVKGRDLLVFSLHFDEDAMPTFTIQSWR
jgi:hypothetical protein